MLPLGGRAETDMHFARYRDKAVPLDGSISEFLDSYVGACTGFFEGQDCRDKAAKFRDEMTGKMLWTVVREAEADMVQMAAFNPATGEFLVRVTPAFPAGRFVLSAGPPKRLDEDGTPLFRVLEIPVRRAGADPAALRHLFDDKLLRVIFVFTPREVWTVESGDQKRQGVTMDLHAMLITINRTGEKVAAWYEAPPPGAKAPAPAPAPKKSKRRR